MQETSYIQKSRIFHEVVEKILSKHYFIEKAEPIVVKDGKQNYRADFMTDQGVYIEVKYFARNDFSSLMGFKTILQSMGEDKNFILVVNLFSATVHNGIIRTINKYFDFPIISLENLLYLCDGDKELKSELLSCIDFSTDGVIPLALDYKANNFLLASEKEPISSKSKQNDFEKRLESIQPGKEDFSKFEDFYYDFIKTVFQDSIESIIKQKTNNKDMFRFDMVAALKEDPKSFWKFIYDKFNSCFILFECKNYSEKIGQEQVYLTERYLYNNALRNVAIIFTRKGADNNAIKATQDVLKEHGKLILIFDDKDLVKIHKMYEDFLSNTSPVSPSQYLLSKTKEFLLNLDK